MTEVSIEGHDTFTQSATRVDFNLRVWGGSEDGFDIMIPDGAPLCLDVNQASGGVIYVGGNRILATAPIDLTTMTPCTP